MKQRTQKMWCLVNKTTGRIIKIEVTAYLDISSDEIYAIGFETRSQLMAALGIRSIKELEFDDIIKKFEIEL